MSADKGAIVDIEAGLGRVELVGRDLRAIRVEVRLAPRSGVNVPEDAGRVKTAIAAAKLTSNVDGHSVRFAVIYPTEVIHGAIEESWRVLAPADAGARVQMAVGDLHVAGLAGGVDLQLGIGQIDIDVPRGDMRANLSVGDILASSQSGRIGSVMLTSHVGRVDLQRGGEPVPVPRSAGPGSSLRLSGDGGEWLILSSDVGDVRLEIGTIGQYSPEP